MVFRRNRTTSDHHTGGRGFTGGRNGVAPGAGGLIVLLLGIPDSNRFAQGVVIAAAGGLMIVYVLVGGMRGTTWVQVRKADLLIVTGPVLAARVLGRFVFDLSACSVRPRTSARRAARCSSRARSTAAPSSPRSTFSRCRRPRCRARRARRTS